MWNIKQNWNSNNNGNETISRSFRKHLNKITVQHNNRNRQTSAILGTVYILLKVVMHKYKTFIMGNNNTSIIFCNYSYRMPAILYIREIQFLHVFNCKPLYKSNRAPLVFQQRHENDASKNTFRRHHKQVSCRYHK